MSTEPIPSAGPYTPIQFVAMGSQAAVWQGKGPNGPVVLKFARNDSSRSALRREARVLALLRHPNLVRLVEAGPDGAWLALEQIEGTNFDTWAQIRTFDDIVSATLQLVDTLDHLHRSGVIHGDLKPSNVLVTATGVPTLIDLGVASPLSAALHSNPSSRASGSESFKGTLGYAAPELLRGHPPSPATDMYGLGALLYTAITLRTPFVAADPAALSYLPLVSLPAPPAAFRPDLPAPFNQLILQLLAKDPERRPLDLHKLKESLERCRQAAPASPFLGMLEEREEIWRAVVGAVDGEPRVVVVYGVPGSGRRTLIAEGVECARREGLPYLKGTEPAGALDAIREAGRPVVLVMKGSHKSARQLADTILKEKLSCLLLLHADRPLAGLTVTGAIQLTPSPLSSQDATRIARVWNADVDQAENWWRESMGLPIAFLAKIRLWRRNAGLTGNQQFQFPTESKRIYEALRMHSKGRCEVHELARELQMGEHVLLDHCEVLFAEELIEPVDDGISIGLVRSKGA